MSSCGAVQCSRRLPDSDARCQARGRGRDLQLAVHRQAHQGPGGLRLRLGPGRRGPRRRLRQAGDRRRQPEVQDLRQGARLGVGRHARRGAPHGLHRRPPLHLGRRARGQQDLRLRHRDRSGASRSWCRRSPTWATRPGYLGPHTYYALPGRMLVQALSNTKDKGGVTGMARLQQQGRVHRLATRCRPTTAATATATTWR